MNKLLIYFILFSLNYSAKNDLYVNYLKEVKFNYIHSINVGFFADSLNKKKNKINHIIGVEGGYIPEKVNVLYNYKGHYNLHYIFRYKFFATGLTLGVAPFTIYGSINKSYAFIGLTSNPERLISANFLIGLGPQTISDPVQTDGPYSSPRVLNIGGVYIKPGIFILLSKSKNYILSISSCITTFVVTSKNGSHPSNGFAIFPNIGISKILKSNK